MASRGYLPRNPHLQVGSRVTAALLTAALALTAPSAFAASKSPTPTASAKASATAKPTTSAKASATATATAKATPKVTKKPPVKKKKSKVRVTPSPKPVWPPKGFSVEGEVYAKVPTAKELVGLISANSYLEKQIKECGKYICGAVQVAAVNGCIWWQAVAVVTDGQGNKLGELTKSFTGTTAREFKTLLMITPETLEQGGAAKITSVICNHVDRDPTVPGSGYVKF